MVEIRKPITVEEAIEKILAKTKTGVTEIVQLAEAGGRYLAEDVLAREPVPPFDRTMMDGFAVRAEDTSGATPDKPARLKVIARQPAGTVTGKRLGPGEAVRIMTGAPIPAGADAVVMLEAVKELRNEDGEWCEITQPAAAGEHIAKQGEYTRQNEIVVPRGERVNAGVMAVLATFGYSNVKVYRQPVVGIFAFGSELLPPDSLLMPGKIRNSNSFMVCRQVENIGAVPKYFGTLPDDFGRCFHAVQEALNEVDVLITTGGASVGDYDYIGKILQDLGAEVLFNKVAMRPGSVTTVAVNGEQWIFGLSGNPASCYVGLELFVRPVLKSALGANNLHLARCRAILREAVPTANPYTRFMRGIVETDGHRLVTRSAGIDKPGMVTALSKANALIVIPGGSPPLDAGAEVDVLMLDG